MKRRFFMKTAFIDATVIAVLFALVAGATKVQALSVSPNSSSPGTDYASGDFSRLMLAPSNDDMSAAIVIGALPYTNTVDTTEATVEGSEPTYTCGYNVGATVWYRYTAASDGEFVVDTNGSNFNTVLHVFLDDGTPTFIDCDNDGGTATQSQRSITGSIGTTYLIGVGGINGASGSLIFNLHQPGPYTTCASVDVPAVECNALVNFYTDTVGTSWDSDAGWLASNELCTWEGLECFSGNVYRVQLPYNSLSGAWVTDLTGLSELQILDLTGNDLSGDLSTLMAKLPTTIQYIYMNYNGFSGGIPASVLGFTNLDYFLFSSNDLSGDFGTAIGNLPSATIQYISLEFNSFTGTLPSTLADFSYLRYFEIGYNDLGGDLGVLMDYIPTSVWQLRLRGNNFTGTIPASTLDLVNMWGFDVSDNQLDGDLTAVLENMPLSIMNLYLKGNNFTGSIPSTINGLTNLRTFMLGYNDGLVGEIPIEITDLPLNTFRFDATYLCEPGGTTYSDWVLTVGNYAAGICGYAIEDLTIVGMSTTPAVPLPGVPFTTTIQVRNVGGTASTPSVVDLYPMNPPTGCGDPGDNTESFGSIAPGYVMDVILSIPGQPAGVYDAYAYVDNACIINELDEYNNQFGPQEIKITSNLFEADHETGDLSQWSSVNTGGGFLYACTQAAMNGTYGACVERGTNDNRKQLIDQTPTDETVFSARFNFDVNSLSMGLGEPVRIMQMKMGSERPVFLVLQRFSGGYAIQLNVKEDDLSKTKTPWIYITNAPHTIEVDWAAASTPTANDGYVELYIDDALEAAITGLDNSSFTILSYRMGFTSRLAGKSISGIFYIDDVATSTLGYIGLP